MKIVKKKKLNITFMINCIEIINLKYLALGCKDGYLRILDLELSKIIENKELNYLNCKDIISMCKL